WDPPPRASAVITPDKGVSVPKPLDPSQVTKPAPPAPRRRRHRGWELETQWQECLVYPFAGFPLIFSLAAALTLLTGITAIMLPRFLADESATANWLLHMPLLVIPLVILGYTCGFLDCTLNSATTGRVQQVRWPGGNLLLVVRSCAVWLVCFLAVPAEL